MKCAIHVFTLNLYVLCNSLRLLSTYLLALWIAMHMQKLHTAFVLQTKQTVHKSLFLLCWLNIMSEMLFKCFHKRWKTMVMKKTITKKQTGIHLKIRDILKFIFQENRCWIANNSQRRETNLNQNRLRNQTELIIENCK